MLFFQSEQYFTTVKYRLTAPLPAQVQQIVLGFLRHFAAEVHFVRAAVFLGTPPDLIVKEEAYAGTLVQTFDVASELYPEFVDTYYLAQSSLAHISPAFAGKVIGILERGIDALPGDLVLPFFKGFDHFYYRQEVGYAAKIFAELATRPGCPTWLGHLAAIFSAQGGELSAGLMSLRVMFATEENKAIRERYAADIVSFENALRIQDATIRYHQKYQKYPTQLRNLIPEYFERLPDVGRGFELLWIPPKLRLLRP